jgi:tellurite resistance protein
MSGLSLALAGFASRLSFAATGCFGYRGDRARQEAQQADHRRADTRIGGFLGHVGASGRDARGRDIPCGSDEQQRGECLVEESRRAAAQHAIHLGDAQTAAIVAHHIESRCVTFALTIPDAPTATQWLREQGIKEPAQALAAAGFSPLLAMQGDAQTGTDERAKLLAALRQPASLDVFALAEMLQKTEQVLVVQWLQQWSYDLSAMKLAGSVRYHMGEEETIKKLVASIAPLNLARLQKLLQTSKREAQHTLNPKLFFESLLLAYRQLLSD